MLPHMRGVSSDRSDRHRHGDFVDFRRRRYERPVDFLNNSATSFWGAVFFLVFFWLYMKQLMMIEMDEEAGGLGNVIERDNIPFPLTIMKPKELSTIQRIGHCADDGSKTPLIISHTLGSAYDYMQAAIESNVLPREPSTMLHMTSKAILPAPQPGVAGQGVGNLATPASELSPPRSFLLAAVASGLANRIFLVEPAPDSRDKLEYSDGEVHYQHMARQEPIKSECKVTFNDSNLLELHGGDAASCCDGCVLPSPVDGKGQATETSRSLEFLTWRGQLADASKVVEVDYDAEELINAIVPVGAYVLSIEMSFFALPEETPPAQECRWLTDKPVAQRCVMPLSKTPPGTPLSISYPAAVSNVIRAALSTHDVPTELPPDCVLPFETFRSYMWGAAKHTRLSSFVKHHPFLAAGELCSPKSWRSKLTHREETMQALWVKRRVETVRRFLLEIKKFVQDEIVQSLRNLRLLATDVTVIDEFDAYDKVLS